MKILKGTSIAAALVFSIGMAAGASAEMTNVFGPIYITKHKHERHEARHESRHEARSGSRHEARHGHGKHKKEAEFRFTAPVPGKGVLIVRNAARSGEKRHRVSSAEIELNGHEVADEKDFNKKVEELRFDVDLLAENTMEIEVKSCKHCELEVTVIGQALPTRDLPTRVLPTR